MHLEIQEYTKSLFLKRNQILRNYSAGRHFLHNLAPEQSPREWPHIPQVQHTRSWASPCGGNSSCEAHDPRHAKRTN